VLGVVWCLVLVAELPKPRFGDGDESSSSSSGTGTASAGSFATYSATVFSAATTALLALAWLAMISRPGF